MLWNVATSLGKGTGCERATLKGHLGCITSIAFSPDGTTIASASEGEMDAGSVKLWDVTTGQMKRTLKAHPDSWQDATITSVSFGPDGRTLAAGSRDGTVKLWDLAMLPSQGAACEKTSLSGHSREVTSVSFSPDGAMIASGSTDDTVRLWDVSAPVHKGTGHQMAVLKGHSAKVNSVAFSPDGTTLVSASHDRTLRLWNVRTGRERAMVRGPFDEIVSADLSPDGTTLAAGSRRGTVRLWEVTTGRQKATLAGESGAVTGVRFSPDGATLASCSKGTVKLWDLETGHIQGTLGDQATSGGHEVVSFSSDGATLASTHRMEVTLWDVATRTEKLTLNGHSGRVTNTTFCPDGGMLASGSADGTVKLWDVGKGRERATLTGHSDGISALSFGPEGTVLASGCQDGCVKLWDVAAGRETATFTTAHGRASSIDSVSFSLDGATLASGHLDGTVRFWDVAAKRETATLATSWGSVRAVVFAPDGHTMVSASEDGTIKVWEMPPPRTEGVLRRYTDRVTATCFSPGGRTLAVANRESAVDLWDVATQREKATLRSSTHPMNSLCFSPDGRTLAAAGGDAVTLWSAVTTSHKATFRVHLEGRQDGVGPVRFSPDGATLAVATSTSIRLFDVATHSEKRRLRTEITCPGVLCFSPDGRTLASGYRGASGLELPVEIWDVTTGKRKTTLGGRRSGATCMSFGVDGVTLAWGKLNGNVKLWDVSTGREKSTLRGHSCPVLNVRFSPDGATLVSGDANGGIKAWDVATCRERPILVPFDDLAIPPTTARVLTVCEAMGVAGWLSEIAPRLEEHDASTSFLRRFLPDQLSCLDIASDSDGRILASGGTGNTVALWDVRGRRPVALTEANRLTGCRLQGFTVVPMPLEVLLPRQSFVACGGFYFQAPERPVSQPSPYFRPCWGDHNPNRWLTGALKGEAKALYHLGLVRERLRQDADARKLHERARAVADAAQTEWAQRSRWRLRHIPWLQSWWPACRNAMSCLESSHFEAGMAAYRRGVKGLSADDRRRFGRQLAPRLVGLGESHWVHKDYEAAERYYELAIEIAPDVPETQYALARFRVMRKLESREYEAAASECANVQGLTRDAARQLAKTLGHKLMLLAIEHGRRKESALSVQLWELAFELGPDRADVKRGFAFALNRYARDLLTHESARKADAAKALPMALQAVELSEGRDPNIMDTLALAYFKTGDATRAVETQEKAIALLPRGEQDPKYKEFSERLATFRAAAKKLEPKR